MSGGEQSVMESELWLDHDPEEIRRAEKVLLDAVARQGYPDAACFAVRLALEEAVFNAFHHGHRNLPREKVRLAWKVAPDQIVVTVEDRGPGFDPAALPDPTAADRLELPHGRGVMLMRAYMSEVRFNPKGNRVTMIYRRPT